VTGFPANVGSVQRDHLAVCGETVHDEVPRAHRAAQGVHQDERAAGAEPDVVEAHPATPDHHDTAPPGGERRAGRVEKWSAYS
jgi:hypothetical protein